MMMLGFRKEVKFVKDKETKNMIRFTATGDEISGSIYVAKTSDLASQVELVLVSESRTNNIETR